LSKGGLDMAQIKQIAFEACMDPRFCEIRSWISHGGELGPRHWECVGLVDVKTIWQTLCKTRGEFCSLRAFYKAIPDFYVPKKKERCVCTHCKKGRRALDNLVVIINALRRSEHGDEAVAATLAQIRVDLVTLRGHLDKELVVDIDDGRHRGDTQCCNKCALQAIGGHLAKTCRIICDWRPGLGHCVPRRGAA
jgi:hypothetical protein